MSINQDYFDRYSIPHAALGAVFAASRVPPEWAIASHIFFEAVEDHLKDAVEPMWPMSTHDSPQNHVGDIVSFVGGYYAAEALDDTREGRGALTAFVMLGAGVWMYNLLNREPA